MNTNAETVKMGNVFHMQDKSVLPEDFEDCVTPLLFPEGIIMLPSKAGYIMITTDHLGFIRKFAIENSPQRASSSAVLISSMEQLEEVAILDEKTRELFQRCCDDGTLLGCFLPWKKEAMDQYMPDNGSINFATNGNSASCFVVNHGLHSEVAAKSLWDNNKILSFASAVKSDGVGNFGKLKDINHKILNGVDLIVENDDFIHTQNMCKLLEKNGCLHCEPGVILSMVSDDGQLDDEPTVIRTGRDMDTITGYLSDLYGPLF